MELWGAMSHDLAARRRCPDGSELFEGAGQVKNEKFAT